ncbi:hypothetical protein B9Z19DRAFT_1060209 [Tuber borchii]|uniref:Uncharacterized protein n=1 Tax=Tuber borchii TaxID=42251 RepID=A0A2T7A9C8_TUBBO|nr:hypothetical protein B9Z19DRAFT_1060209 [Tuber borchii]
MVQSPEASSFLAASTARKRRLEDLLTETPNDLKLLWETTTATGGQSHQTTIYPPKRSLFLTSKFTTTSSPHLTTTMTTTTTTPSKLKPPLPKLSHRVSSPMATTTQNPKLKRFRASSPPPIEMEDYDDYMHTSQDNPAEVPLGLSRAVVSVEGGEGGGRGTPRCHVCSRVQSFAASFATVTNCGRCAGSTCYVCTRRCDSCDVTVCSGCAEEEAFCRGFFIAMLWDTSASTFLPVL